MTFGEIKFTIVSRKSFRLSSGLNPLAATPFFHYEGGDEKNRKDVVVADIIRPGSRVGAN
jgi:hypothetical protein